MKIKQITVSLLAKRMSKSSMLLMKLSSTMYLLCCFQRIESNSFSQNKVTLTLKNTSLQSILKRIESQTTYSFVFNNDDIAVRQNFRYLVANPEDIQC